MTQDTQVPNDQQQFSQNLHATARQPHFAPLKPPYHLQPHQYTQSCGSNGKSGVSPVHHLSVQQQEVAPQGNLEEIVGIEKHCLFIGWLRYWILFVSILEPPYHLPTHQHTPPWGQFEQQHLFPQLLHPSSQGKAELYINIYIAAVHPILVTNHSSDHVHIIHRWDIITKITVANRWLTACSLMSMLAKFSS